MTQMTARLRAMARLPAPNRAGWHQAIRMTLAAAFAYVATALVGLNHGYWAVITCLIIVQGSLGATIGAGIMRLAGTAAGGILGGVGVLLLRLQVHLPELAVLLIVIVPATLLAASRPIYRLAPFTGALVLLLAGSGDFTFALARIAEIALGCLIGILVSLLVLPERATAVLVDHAAAILDQLGEFALVQLTGNDLPARQNYEGKLRRAFAQIQNDLKEVEHERSVLLLRNNPFPERLLRQLQRLRTDVNMLGRAVPAPAEGDHHIVATAIKQQFAAAAATLRGGRLAGPAERPEPPVQAGADTPLGFALMTLQDELAAFDQLLQEHAGHAA